MRMRIPGTSERVIAHSSPDSNRRIAEDTERRVAWHAAHPDTIPHRLAELEREWDVERTLQANAATLSLAGVMLGATLDRRFFAIPGLVAAFLLQHAVQGWCPPLPILRRLGVRTQREIDEERFALKTVRGDFESAGRGAARGDGHWAMKAVRA